MDIVGHIKTHAKGYSAGIAIPIAVEAQARLMVIASWLLTQSGFSGPVEVVDSIKWFINLGLGLGVGWIVSRIPNRGKNEAP